METRLSDRSQSEFNPYRCGSCGRAEQKDLKLCSGCRLISFCSAQCQQSYWKRHQQLCRVISKIISVDKKASIFEVRKEETVGLEGARRLMKAIVLLNKNLPTLLGRELWFEEHLVRLLAMLSEFHFISFEPFQLLSYPKYCEVCYETDPMKLTRCPGCKFSAFCKDGDCQVKAVDNPSIHTKYCSEKKIAFLCHRDAKYEKIFTEMPTPLNYEEFLQIYPNRNLFTLIEHLSGKTFIQKPLNRLEMVSFATVCQFNFTATIINALSHANLLHPDRECLHIHIVGAKYEETYFDGNTCCLFYVFMPKLHSLKINLIGPELSPPSSRTEEVDSFGRTVKIGYHKMFYENFTAGPNPDFIICFNCGFSEEPYSEDTNWARGVRKILSRGIPFAFTSYTKSELFDEIDFVRRVAAQLNVFDLITGVFVGDNDFKDLRPFQNFDKASDEPLYYGNQKLCVMSWKEYLGEEEFVRLKLLFTEK